MPSQRVGRGESVGDLRRELDKATDADLVECLAHALGLRVGHHYAETFNALSINEQQLIAWHRATFKAKGAKR